jgi:hypothetical protein
MQQGIIMKHAKHISIQFTWTLLLGAALACSLGLRLLYQLGDAQAAVPCFERALQIYQALEPQESWVEICRAKLKDARKGQTDPRALEHMRGPAPGAPDRADEGGA